jgi:hypothetical protein
MKDKNNSNLTKMKGFPFDKHRCFFIKDFSPGDSITIRKNNNTLERGVVEKVDMKSLEVIYKISDSTVKRAFTNQISSLSSYDPKWLVADED